MSKSEQKRRNVLEGKPMTAPRFRAWRVRLCALVVNNRDVNDEVFGDEIDVIEHAAVQSLERELAEARTALQKLQALYNDFSRTHFDLTEIRAIISEALYAHSGAGDEKETI